MAIVTQFSAPVIIFLLTVASGVWLSRSGKPLNTALFTVHKLIALAAVVAAVTQTYTALKVADIPAILIALIILLGLCVVALFATGALMSMNKPAYTVLRTTHQVTLLLAIVVGSAMIYLLTSM
jgi:hypothetical protein